MGFSTHVTAVLSLDNELATETLARRLAQQATGLLSQGKCPTGLTLYLEGDLGAGKTTFVRYMLRELGVQGRIKSPTYGLAENYDLSPAPSVWHFDFYRLDKPQEWKDAGLAELWLLPVLRLAEWPKRAGHELPTPDMILELSMFDATEHSRTASLNAFSPLGKEWIAGLDELNLTRAL